VTRRYLIGSLAAVLFAARSKLRIGVTDWNLNLGADPQSVPLAKQLGFDGVQVSFGRKLKDGKLPADNPEVIAHYLELSKKYRIPIDGTCVDKLHDNGLKSDKVASRWVLDSIRLTQALHSKVLLLPFFGRWALRTQPEMDHTVEALRDLAPEAVKAGVFSASKTRSPPRTTRAFSTAWRRKTCWSTTTSVTPPRPVSIR
jgi:L-ribulose-5-phosphate 3-epimerase